MEVVKNAWRWRKFAWIQVEVQGRKSARNELWNFSVEIIKIFQKELRYTAEKIQSRFVVTVHKIYPTNVL